jgi:hypothetical protein
MSQEDAELARLLRLARQADLPDAARLARVRARVLPPTAAVTTPSAEAAGVPATTSKTVGVLGSKVILGLAAASLIVWSYRELAPPASPSPAPVATPVVSDVPNESEVRGEPRETETARPLDTAGASADKREEKSVQQRDRTLKRAAPRVRERVSAVPVPASDLAEETAMLQMASVAVRAGQLDQAKATLAEFARRFPNSQLTADRLKLEHRLALLRK